MDINAVLSAIYWVILVTRTPNLIRNWGEVKPTQLWLTIFFWAVANTVKIDTVVTWTDSLGLRPGMAVFASNILFMVMTYFMTKYLWQLAKPPGNVPSRHSNLGLRTGLVLGILVIIYLGNLIILKGYDDTTQSDLLDPFATLYWILYKGNFGLALAWLLYYFYTTYQQAESTALKIRTGIGVLAGLAGVVHFYTDVVAQILGYFSFISISTWRLIVENYSNPFVLVGTVLIALALIVPVKVFAWLVNAWRRIQYIGIYELLRPLAAEMKAIRGHDALPDENINRLYLKSSDIDYYVLQRVVLISDGIRFLSRYLSENDLPEGIVLSESSQGAPSTQCEGNQASSAPSPKFTAPAALANLIVRASELHRSGVELEEMAKPLPISMPSDHYDLLLYMTKLARTWKRTRREKSKLVQRLPVR